MPLINVLDENTINQIAAGEVVERPSAIVKELVENAMDAGATAITAEIKEGGLSFIRITDNGCGIAKEDIPLAFLRHATSKIASAADLLNVTSLGFRGEALSSIAAVSQVEMITKTPASLLGYRYLIEGGEEKAFEEIGCPGGTTIIVRNIFYNTPARRKFLKSAMTEAGYISDLMERLIVSHPEVSFKFIVNNQVKLQSSGNNSSKDNLYSIYGRDIARELLPVSYESETVRISGFIGKPAINRGNRSFENYFINGRYIKSNVIIKAIEEAYKPFLMQHKYPFTSIYYQIEPSLIDVNVHPQKLEIRLKNAEEIYQVTYNLIRDALNGKDLIPKISLTKQQENRQEALDLPEPFEENRRNKTNHEYGTSSPFGNQAKAEGRLTADYQAQTDENAFIQNEILKESGSANYRNSFVKASEEYDSRTENSNYDKAAGKPYRGEYYGASNKNTDYISATRPLINKDSPLAEALSGIENNAPFISKEAAPEHRIIGQIFATYWLVEYKKDLYIIDQHAAHEKVLYERLMAAAKTKSYASQQLYPPLVLTLTLKEQEILSKYEEELKTLGYEFEHFGGREYSVRAVPANLYNISEKELLLEFIDALAEEVAGQTLSAASVLERAASLSCKAAVKANHTLSYEEAAALIKELLTLENPYHCPHGRPVIISMSQYELERKFKRII